MNDATVGVLATLAAGFAVYWMIGLIFYIILVIANWKIFTKAGEAGWKSIIPILNTYVLFKISWKGSMFWLMALLMILGSFLSGSAGDGGLLSIVGPILSLLGLLIGIIDVHKLSKSFGHGILFTLGLLFFCPIFTLILGLGGSKYIGPNGVRQ